LKEGLSVWIEKVGYVTLQMILLSWISSKKLEITFNAMINNMCRLLGL
jgi:hypothetical protein